MAIQLLVQELQFVRGRPWEKKRRNHLKPVERAADTHTAIMSHRCPSPRVEQLFRQPQDFTAGAEQVSPPWSGGNRTEVLVLYETHHRK